jgi:transcriptional regulator GlxA family with amidase domain
VTSVCTGSFVLAAAGLLSGRRATTHWAWCDTLASAYPDITVEPDSIYVRDGNVWTAAGVTSGIDLALALVAEDRGHALAAEVARQLVVYLRRSGGQSQFSAPLAAQSNAQSNARAHARSTQSTGELQHLLAWIVDNLARDLTVPALAAKVHLSERQFTRVFKAAVGATPAEHVEAYA